VWNAMLVWLGAMRATWEDRRHPVALGHGGEGAPRKRTKPPEWRSGADSREGRACGCSRYLFLLLTPQYPSRLILSRVRTPILIPPSRASQLNLRGRP
jgi:hypothetical protein